MYDHLLNTPSAKEILENFLNTNEQHFGVEWRKRVEDSLNQIQQDGTESH